MKSISIYVDEASWSREAHAIGSYAERLIKEPAHNEKYENASRHKEVEHEMR
ncbi:MAG TPA: hypothetical protein VG498_14810 [Terriglobales bacterium]|nr:hypothetical protein [Terriglobales bacterium]